MKTSNTCGCCGKPLTDPNSIHFGMGPVCRINNKISEHKKKDINMFGNRAQYTWGTDGEILWLKDQSTDHRSLTNDIENCLVEVSEQLPTDKKLSDYRIIYKDSMGEWDGIVIIDDSTLDNDLIWLKHCTEQNQAYYSRIKINFFAVQQTSYEEAKKMILESNTYKHYDKTVGI